MLNQVVLVGRIVSKPELIELDNGRKVIDITLAIPRNYKNVNGEYDTDFVTCTLWNGVAENTVNYVDKGDLIGVKGHVVRELTEKEDNKSYNLKIIAERVSFLSSKKIQDEEKDNEQDLER